MSTVRTDPRAAVLDSIKELPPLPLVVRELMSVMSDVECSSDEINRILSSDQALASKILRLVNSSFYGLPGRVSTIPRAVVILGHAALRNLATGLSVADSLGKRLPPRRRQLFWRHALTSAAGAEIIARRVRLPEPEEAFVAGLLHDIGHLILVMSLPDEHLVAFESGELGDLERERELIGLDHCRAGRQLLQHWKLPAPLLECVRLHHATDACRSGETPLLTAVALADRLSRVLGAPGEAPAADDDLIELAAAFGLGAGDLIGLLPEIRQRALEARSFLNVADIENSTDSEAAAAAGLPAVVVGGNAARCDWLTALAIHHGLVPRDLRAWLTDPASQAGTIVICDPFDLEPAQAERLRPLLERSGGHLHVVARRGESCPACPQARAISLAFSVGELDLGDLGLVPGRLHPQR